MAKRGPKSAAELALVTSISRGERPSPPDELTERQADIWRETVATEPVNLFCTAVLKGMLGDYCRHKEAAELVSGVISTFKPEWLKNSDGAKRYKELLSMRDQETRAAVGIATKLRLTNQSRYTPQAAATASRNAAIGSKPWEL